MSDSRFQNAVDGLVADTLAKGGRLSRLHLPEDRIVEVVTEPSRGHIVAYRDVTSTTGNWCPGNPIANQLATGRG
jgi:hypothetical protein